MCHGRLAKNSYIWKCEMLTQDVYQNAKIEFQEIIPRPSTKDELTKNKIVAISQYFF